MICKKVGSNKLRLVHAPYSGAWLTSASNNPPLQIFNVTFNHN